MKINRFILSFSIVVVLFSPFFSSCKKAENTNNYSYFVSKDYIREYTATYITNLLDIATISLPEISQVKPLVKSDVKVYKIVYRTTVNGNEINASGLICVPVTLGEYPVLSFQNGTNTINADAPSEFPSDFNYELIEIVASLGYIVTIADYPGFGESSQIPHPYLIAEPTVRSLVDMLYAVKEISGLEFPGITSKNEFYLLGYSQGGWATLALHKALELNYNNDFNLAGSSCGAGAYDISQLLNGMLTQSTYPVPAYLAYIVNAYTAYNQFTNPASDIFNDPYDSRISSLFNGLLSLDQIDDQLTTSITGLLTPEFISGFNTDSRYSSIRNALSNNSIAAWHTYKPLLMTHGGSDTQVNPSSTESMYSALIQSGTSPDIITKIIVPNVDHSNGILPCMIQGLLFLNNLKNSK